MREQASAASRPSWEWSGEITDATQGARVRRAFRDYLLRYANELDVLTSELIFGELLANVVQHAPGAAFFFLEWRDMRPTLLVADRGTGLRGEPRRTFSDPNAEHGRGLALVRTLARDMLIGERPGGGTYVSVILPGRRTSRRK